MVKLKSGVRVKKRADNKAYSKNLMKLIVGLGNPGSKYQKTKHNLGFRVVEELGKQLGDSIWQREDKFKSEIISLNNRLLLAKPQTYMNESGEAVKVLLDYFKISLDDLIIIHDELDLSLGKIKISLGGSGAGHHGVESIIEKLKSGSFVRIRLGIGNLKSKIEEEKDHYYDESSKYVLSVFSQKDQVIADKMVKKALAAVNVLIKEGLDAVQRQFH